MPKGDIAICLEEAEAFLSIAKEQIERQELVGLTAQIYPTVVNAAFSCELSLKAILMTRSVNGEYPSRHRLKTDLFEKLPAQDQEEIRRRSNAVLSIGFADALDEFNDAFCQWRYALENGVGIHYEELVVFAGILLSYSRELIS